MSLFTLPDGSAGLDPSQLGTDYGVSSSVGDGYGFATGVSADASSATSSTLGQLQSGGTSIDPTPILMGGLAALVAADSISHGLTAQGNVPVYRTPAGGVYPVGTGPASNQGLGLLLVLAAVVFLVIEGKK